VATGWCVLVLLTVGGGRRLPSLAAASRPARTVAPWLLARAERAAETMKRAEAFLAAERRAAGVLPGRDAADDRTGLVGGEVTPLVTTLGNLEAKRIATNPEWARTLVLQLAARDLGAGDVVAAGFSGSFPGLNLAVTAACQSLGIDLVAVSSVTASTWGANQAGFTWPEMELRLVRARLIRRASIAVAAGGDADVAGDLDAEGRALARQIRNAAAAGLGVEPLEPRDFPDAVDRRLAACRRAADGRPIRLYVNVGGADASLGRSSAVLRLRSGFLPPAAFGRRQLQGVAARFAGEGTPLLLLLNVRDLALRWGIPLR
jgi:poly-gamma-glutamate system protein